MKNDTFSTLHPLVNFAYFALVIVFGMFFLHPVCLAASLVGSFAYSVFLKGEKAIKFNILYMLPMLIFAALINPAFNHAGATILIYLSDGNPITLESIIYGAAAACMFISIIMWFSCYNAIMTSDKFIYLFGRIIPALSLIFSMVLRFVPRYAAQIRQISNAQRCIGRDVSQGKLLKRAKNGITILSIMMTWALENAIETADSMKSRGYGLPHRTSFSLFRFDNRDKAALLSITVLASIVLVGAAAGENVIIFFPTVRMSGITYMSSIVYCAYFVLCLLPCIIDTLEEIKWKRIESKI